MTLSSKGVLKKRGFLKAIKFANHHAYDVLIKRFLDIIISLCVIVCLLSWLIPLLGLLIVLESKGSVFYIHQRAGKNGKYFPCIKFRSMRDAGAFVQATRGDARVTGIGKFIRRTSIDELPQVFNVLMGHMSIVGPRPHVKELNDQFGHLPHYSDRLKVRPGMTGLSQVLGLRGETRTCESMEKRLASDLHYIEHQSTWLDVKIMLKTIDRTLLWADENAY